VCSGQSRSSGGELLACLDADNQKLAILREAGEAVATRRALQVESAAPVLEAYVA
jgi:hypothetical protein